MLPSKTESSEEEEEFVDVWTNAEGEAPTAAACLKDNKGFYEHWVDKSSGKLAIPAVAGSDALRALYPDHSLILTKGYSIRISFPGATVTAIEKTQLINNLFYVPVARSLGTVPGTLGDEFEYGAFKVTWKQYEYIVYTIQFPQGFGLSRQYFILHKGPEEISRLFLLAAGAWANSLHDEIWVFNRGRWSKDHSLWVEIQKADWKDVILKEEFKKGLQEDVYGFFSSETVYKELAIPWKRGLMMHGPPGNGKTISVKAIMKTCGEKGFAPLYVKSFKNPNIVKGEEGSMADVFNKARELAPCVIVLEDLDSLINDGNRSVFLNQLDGLEGNDGLLIVGTTNHFDRLDPGLSTRPSRFDRKYEFDDPDEEERKLYCQYWQTKLQSNKDIDFPDRLVAKIAHLTNRFSFAYFKEAFVSSLVTIAGIEGEKPSFENLLVNQIVELRKQLGKPTACNHFPTLEGYSDISMGRGRALPPRPPAQISRRGRASSFDVHADIFEENMLRLDTNASRHEPAAARAVEPIDNLYSDFRMNRDGANSAGIHFQLPIWSVFGPEEGSAHRIRTRQEHEEEIDATLGSYRVRPANAGLSPTAARPSFTPSPSAQTSTGGGAGSTGNPSSCAYRRSREPTLTGTTLPGRSPRQTRLSEDNMA